jgi:GeoRSP system SPASM domain protein
MNLKELTSPISVYWDIDHTSRQGIAFHRNICEELIENKVLSLNITEPGAFLSSECLSVMDRLMHEPIAVSLTVSPTALNAESIGLLRDLKPRALLVKAASREELHQLADLRREAGALPLGVSIEVDRHNFVYLPEVLSFCITNGIVNLVLPMQRLTNAMDGFCLSAAERLELAAALKGMERLESLKIVIHDPFLWRAFYPSVIFPEGGCQAANTMLYLSPEADVYPCPSLPIKLGSLLKESFKELVLSQKKKELRKVLAAPPRICGDCDELHLCLGGCRGRAYRMKGSLTEPDPACQ